MHTIWPNHITPLSNYTPFCALEKGHSRLLRFKKAIRGYYLRRTFTQEAFLKRICLEALAAANILQPCKHESNKKKITLASRIKRQARIQDCLE